MRLTKNMIDHIRNHANFPATKTELVKHCNNLADFTKDEKTWFAKKLPSGTYYNANDVIATLSG